MNSRLAPIFESPNTRKNKRDYVAVNKFWLFESNTPVIPPRKKRAVEVSKSPSPLISSHSTASSAVSNSLLNLDTDIQPSQSVSQVQYEVEGVRNKDEDSTKSKEGAGYGNTIILRLNLGPGD
jgi:hypothetical protein